MGPMNANDGTKDHDKSTDEAENSFDDNSKIDGDLTNLLNQIKEGNQLSDPFSPTNQDKEDMFPVFVLLAQSVTQRCRTDDIDS